MRGAFAIFFLVLVGISLGLNALFAALIVAHRRRSDAARATGPSGCPKAAVFLTLRNRDDGLEENLASVFSTDYPSFEIFLAVDRTDDPCASAIERTRARFPLVKATVVAAGHAAGSNPKIAKLSQLEKLSDAPLVWVLDSDVRVTPRTLGALVSELERSGCHLLFGPVRCRGGRTFGSMLEMSFVNFFLSGSIIAAWKLFRQRVVVGKSLLIDRAALSRFGGFSYWSDVVAEDHWLGETFFRSGFRVRCAGVWVDNVKESTGLWSFIGRVDRWAKLRFNLKRPVYLLEILFNPLALCLLLIPVLKAAALPVAAVVVVLRILLEYAVFFSVNTGDRRRWRAVLSVAPAAIVKDLITAAVYFVPFFSRSLIWRGGTIKIAMDTRIRLPAAPLPPGTAAVAVLMGMGHLRAAFPLKSACGRVEIYGSETATPPEEYRLWRSIRDSYYFLSRAGELPIAGGPLLALLNLVQKIDPPGSRKDLTAPNAVARYVDRLITRRGLCRSLVERLAGSGGVVHSYFATALAADRAEAVRRDNYLVICDAGFNRVWVPPEPRKSRLRYFAPCASARRRLLSYGVSPEKIFLTGFPLPKENIGGEQSLEILRADLAGRLARLDPFGKMKDGNADALKRWLDTGTLPEKTGSPLTVMFAVGGAGAQTGIAFSALNSLSAAIRGGGIRFLLSVGTEKRIYEKALYHAARLNLRHGPGESLQIIFDIDPFAYLEKFNACLRTTDVLWTKPSELVFYCGLGLPILLAPSIGTHEELNRQWLLGLGAAVRPAGPVSQSGEWLFSLRDSGALAAAAWAGFLRGRKLGTFKIERILAGEPVHESDSPLER